MKHRSLFKGVAIGIAFIIFLMPFFWIKPGEFDIGGDSARLYLYDPFSYTKAIGLYGVNPEGVGEVTPNYYLLPFLSLQMLFFALLRSPYLFVVLEKSLKFTFAYWFIYLIVKELLSRGAKKSYTPEISGMLAGLFYLFSPAVVETTRAALVTHNQIFLNPMMFYLLLRFIKSGKQLFLWGTLLITLAWSPNFSLIASPPPFAFYPLSIAFLILYTVHVLKRSFPWGAIVGAGLLFVGLHAFQLIPTVAYVINPDSALHARAIEAATSENPGLAYFNANVGFAKVTDAFFPYRLFVAPLIILVGFIASGSKLRRLLSLTGGFFLITLFLVSANITNLGLVGYRLLFQIPGFSMFRNFVGQFQFVSTFFYALLFGVSAGVLFVRLKQKYSAFLFVCCVGLFTWSALPFVRGEVVNFVHDTTNGVRAVVRMDPAYEEALGYLRTTQLSGKILTLPLSDFYMQVLHGVNDGAYIGPSTISFLTGKNDFPAYHMFGEFAEIFLRLVREQKYQDIRRLLAILNIRYIFHNADSNIYEAKFPERPYSYLLHTMPATQKDYTRFIAQLADKKIYQQGQYALYEMRSDEYVPLISSPIRVHLYDDDGQSWDSPTKSFFAEGVDAAAMDAYLLRDHCKAQLPVEYCKDKDISFTVPPDISFTKINPTKYIVHVPPASSPFMLVFANQYDSSWRLYQQGTQQPHEKWQITSWTTAMFGDSDIGQTFRLKPLADARHIKINGYANGWLITPGESFVGGDMILETRIQPIFYAGAGISLVFLILFAAWGVRLWQYTRR